LRSGIACRERVPWPRMGAVVLAELAARFLRCRFRGCLWRTVPPGVSRPGGPPRSASPAVRSALPARRRCAEAEGSRLPGPRPRPPAQGSKMCRQSEFPCLHDPHFQVVDPAKRVRALMVALPSWRVANCWRDWVILPQAGVTVTRARVPSVEILALVRRKSGSPDSSVGGFGFRGLYGHVIGR
jgi:hypothetical protein